MCDIFQSGWFSEAQRFTPIDLEFFLRQARVSILRTWGTARRQIIWKRHVDLSGVRWLLRSFDTPGFSLYPLCKSMFLLENTIMASLLKKRGFSL